jgi:hypothetical protein
VNFQMQSKMEKRPNGLCDMAHVCQSGSLCLDCYACDAIPIVQFGQSFGHRWWTFANPPCDLRWSIKTASCAVVSLA